MSDETKWQSWAEDKPGYCPCGIDRRQCDYHRPPCMAEHPYGGFHCHEPLGHKGEHRSASGCTW